jgi:hypothetical protein
VRDWFRLIPRHRSVQYVGADNVSELVAENNRKYGDDTARFVQLDITKHTLPSADPGICGDALFHVSRKNITLTLAQLLDGKIKYLLTTSHTECARNEDTITGDLRLLNLRLPPYEFPEPILWIGDWIKGFPARKMGLWERGALGAGLSKGLMSSANLRKALRKRDLSW